VWVVDLVPVPGQGLVVGLVLALAPVQAQSWDRHTRRQAPAVLSAGQSFFSW